MESPNIAVLGAGVVGLTVARMLQDRLPTSTITVISDKFRQDTTSSVAAGLFTPRSSFKANDPETTKKWIRDSWNYWNDFLQTPEAATAGVSKLSTYVFSKSFPNVVRNPLLEGLLPVYRSVTDEELKLCGGGWKYGSYYDALVINCTYYQPWAEKKFTERGGCIQTRKIDSFQELSAYDLVFNCTGFGAKFLCNDHDLIPVRGQVIKVRAPWIKFAYFGDHDAYIIPSGDGTVTLGGTRQYDSYNLEVCRHDAAAILERCCELVPSLAKAEILTHRVGLRPHRTPVRVESELLKGTKIVHCYGHGGYGVTSAPGTAMDAVEKGLDLLKTNLKPKL